MFAQDNNVKMHIAKSATKSIIACFPLLQITHTNYIVMKTIFTTLQKALASALFLTLLMSGAVNAQGILPPDDPDDLQDLPVIFNVDTDAINWGTDDEPAFTMLPFEGAGLVRIENPDKSGINTTDFVIEYKKGGAGEGGQPWAGFFYNTADTLSITENSVFRLKVWSPRAGINALLKFEMRTNPDVNTGDVIVNIPEANKWVQLEWDLSDFAPTLGAAPLDRVVIIMDLPDGEAGDASENFTWYLDDFEFHEEFDTSAEDEYSTLPTAISLDQNYPNPFNPTTNINFAVPQSQHVTLEVFDMLGQRVDILVDGTMTAGQHSVTFDAQNLPSGMYIYRLRTATEVISRKLTLIK